MRVKHNNRRFLIIAILVFAISWGGSTIPTGYYAFFPGDALSAERMVSVEGGARDARGAFYLTTISPREASLFIHLFALVDPRVSLKTREEYLPRGMDLEEYARYAQRLMDESRAVATVVGLRAAGYPARFTGEGVRVAEVMTDGPANGKLEAGDVILSVDGVPTMVTEDLTEYMAKTPVGQQVTFRVRRGAEHLPVSLTTVEHPTQKGRSAVRIRIETLNPSFFAPIEVSIRPGSITGPSAGLMFTLEIINQADKTQDLTRGKRVAGTGTIAPTGRVGPVGGAAQKVAAAERAGAEYFFVPRENAAEAERAARRIRVVPVETLDEALRFLKSL